MSRDHAHSRSREKEPNSDFIVANLSKETASGTLHALSELQELSQKDPKAFAKVLAKVNEKVDTSFMSIDKNGKSHGDLEIVGFDKCGSLIMKDKSTDELFDPRINLKNGILEIRRPIIPAEQPQTAETEDRHLAPVETREFKPVVREPEPLKADYSFSSEPKGLSRSSQIMYPGETAEPSKRLRIDYPQELKSTPTRQLIEYPR